MPDFTNLRELLPFLGSTDIRILVVVDGSIQTVEAPGAFGIGRVVRLIDQYSRGCSTFTVDTARREPYSGPPDPAQDQGHISIDFRFDQVDGDGNRVIDDYDQIWLFGIRGEGSGPVTSGPELRALTEWMNAGGGLFATGDHATLGASMCSGIPRIREMRRWTAAQQVPPAGTFNRLDTNRPTTPAEASGSAAMAFSHERDTTPQAITWIPQTSFGVGLFRYETPHEVLCHPTHGPIDVMPDHPHEGRTRALSEMNLARDYDFGGGVADDDFPGAANGTGPTPRVIAEGVTMPAPPTSKPYKGDCGRFEFPMISVYDGRSVGVRGRVATDSTWHHWFDLNIYGLEHAADPTDWEKVSRYFENLAVWLSPPGRFRPRCWVITQLWRYPLVEELDLSRFDPRRPEIELGPILRHEFLRVFGSCTTRRFAWDLLCRLHPQICRPLEVFRPIELPPELPDGPFPDPGPVCLTCPPIDLIEEAVFEGIALGGLRFLEANAKEPERLAKLSDARLDKAMDEYVGPAVATSVQQLGQRLTTDLERTLSTWTKVEAAAAKRAGGTATKRQHRRG